MLANLRKIFNPAAVAQALQPMPPLKSTIMDTFFTNRPSHPMVVIGLSELHRVIETVPVVRRDGAPVALGGEDFETQFFAPLPIKVKVAVTASELNDLRMIMSDATAVAAWRSAKIEQIRRTVRLTTEAMCATVLTTGSISWPKQLEGGRSETYTIDYGDPLTHTLGTKLAADSKISDVYDLLVAMEENIQMAGVGGSADFWCGKDVFKVLMDMAQGYLSTADQRMIRVELGAGQASIGGYVIRVLSETYPEPASGTWVPKLNAKTLMAVARDVPGTIWYCALDSISAGLADTLDDWWKKATLVGKGVLVVFESLKDGTGEIKGELATEIKAAGLTGLVTTVSRVVFRVRAALLGFRDAFAAAMHKVDVILVPVRIAVAELMMRIGELFGVFDGGEVDGSVSVWTRFGETLGQIAGGAVQALAQGLVWLMDVLGFFATVIGLAIDGVAGLANWLRDLSGASTEAAAAADPYSWQTLGQWVGYAAGAVFALKAGLLICKGVMLVTSGVMKVWAAAVWLVNAALSANPIVWIIVAIIGLIAAITLMVQNWDWICQKWDEVWAYVGGIIGPIWDSIWGTITSVWQSIVDWVVSVGQTLWSGMQALWDSIVLGAQESWDSLVSSVSGIGQRISDKLLEMWAGVTGFFDGINLYESGAKLLNTFVDGIKSMASAPIKAVEDVLAKVREYLPFSDAHTGPLSQLTLSGTRMMTTIGEGVGQGAPGLVGSVSGALSKAGAAIGNWWAGLSGAERKVAVDVPMPPPSQRAAPDQAVPQALDAGTLMTPLLVVLADMRTSVIDVFTGIDLSESGAKAMGTFADGIKNMADLPIGAVEAALARVRDLFPFSDTHAGPLPQFTLSALPEQPESPELSYRMPEVPGPHMEMPRIPEVPALRFVAPQLPEIPAPALKYSAPELPEIAVDERQSLSAKDGRQGERPAQQSWTVTIQELHLPEVKEANDFVSGLMGEMAQYGEA